MPDKNYRIECQKMWDLAQNAINKNEFLVAEQALKKAIEIHQKISKPTKDDKKHHSQYQKLLLRCSLYCDEKLSQSSDSQEYDPTGVFKIPKSPLLLSKKRKKTENSNDDKSTTAKKPGVSFAKR